MPSRLREALDDLQREVADLTLEPPSAVRARGDALRHRRTATVAISTALAAAAAGAAALPILRPSPTTGLPGSTTTTCATAIWEQPDEASLVSSTHVRVFMALDAAPEQIEVVRQSLTELGLSAEFVDRAQAFEGFKENFACDPDLIRRTRAEDLPESFDVTLRYPAQFDDVRAELTKLPGVDLVHRMPQ